MKRHTLISLTVIIALVATTSYLDIRNNAQIAEAAITLGTFTEAINSTTNNATYTGNVTVSSGSSLLLIFVQIRSDTEVASTDWTVTLGGKTLTPLVENYSTSISAGMAVYSTTTPPTGTNTLSVDGGSGERGAIAYYVEITGYDATTPIASTRTSASWTSDTTSLSVANSTTADNNVVISDIFIRLGTTGIGVSGATPALSGQTGSSAFTDLSAGIGHQTVATAGPFSHNWSWTSTGRAGAIAVEVNAATGGGGGSPVKRQTEFFFE